MTSPRLRCSASRHNAGASGMGLLIVAGLAMAVGGCLMMSTSNGGDSGPTAANAVAIQNFSYSPRSITIPVGQAVRWTNRDPVAHTVTSGNPGDADAGAIFNATLAPEATFEHTFSAPGEFVYFCIPHQSLASMRGAVVIVTE